MILMRHCKHLLVVYKSLSRSWYLRQVDQARRTIRCTSLRTTHLEGTKRTSSKGTVQYIGMRYSSTRAESRRLQPARAQWAGWQPVMPGEEENSRFIRGFFAIYSQFIRDLFAIYSRDDGRSSFLAAEQQTNTNCSLLSYLLGEACRDLHRKPSPAGARRRVAARAERDNTNTITIL